MLMFPLPKFIVKSYQEICYLYVSVQRRNLAVHCLLFHIKTKVWDATAEYTNNSPQACLIAFFVNLALITFTLFFSGLSSSWYHKQLKACKNQPAQRLVPSPLLSDESLEKK